MFWITNITSQYHNIRKERTFMDIYDRLKQKSKPGKVITIVVNKNANERSPLKNLKVTLTNAKIFNIILQ